MHAYTHLYMQLSELEQRWVNKIVKASKRQDSNRSFLDWESDILTATPPLHHRYATATPPLRHRYATATPPLRHRYATATPPLRHRYATATPSLRQIIQL